MKKPYLLAYFFALLTFLPFSEIAYSKEPLSAAIKSKLRQVYPGASEFEWEAGLINTDEVTDFVVLVSVPDPGRASREGLAVFYGDPKGGYQLEAASLLWFHNDRISWNLSVEKKSAFLNFECGALCGNEASNGNFQFKEIGGKLVLIGENAGVYTNPTVNDDGEGHSINYLTRRAIFWRKIGKEHKEIKTRFPDFSPVSLSQFGMWENGDARPREARGYIDEKFKYISY